MLGLKDNNSNIKNTIDGSNGIVKTDIRLS
jgi:hypothetical protein